MNRRLQILLLLAVICLTSVHCLRGALFRSGRSYRYLPLPKYENSENTIDKRSNLVLTPYSGDEAQPLVRAFLYDVPFNGREYHSS